MVNHPEVVAHPICTNGGHRELVASNSVVACGRADPMVGVITVFADIEGVAAEIADCTMLDEVARRLGQKVQTVLGLACVEVVTAAGTVMISNRYSDGRRDFEIGYV